MFTADATIDAVQTAKKTLVHTFVTNETIKDSMIKFIDAQAEYTKKAVKVGIDTATTVTSEAMKQAQSVLNYDWIGASQDFLEALKPATAEK